MRCGCCLVEDEPVKAQLSNGFCKLPEVDGLAHVAVGAEVVSRDQILVLLRGGQKDDREALRSRIGPQGTEYFEATHLRQLEIEQNDLRQDTCVTAFVRATAEKPVERLGPISHDDHDVPYAVFLECSERQCLVVGVVFY